MSSTENHVSPTRSALSDKMEETQQRYIDVLEKRIASLEALLNDESIKNAAASNDGNNNKNKAQGTVDDLSDPDVAKNYLLFTSDKPGAKGVEEEKTWSPEKGRIRYQEERWEEGISKVKDIDLAKPAPPESSNKSWAITSLKKYDENDKYRSTTMILDDPSVRALLQIALAYHPLFRHEQDAMKLASPYESLIHNWDELNELADGNDKSEFVKQFRRRLDQIKVRRSTDAEASARSEITTALAKDDAELARTIEDLKIMLGHIVTTPELSGYFETREAQAKSESISFDFLWSIFPPGELVFSSPVMKQPQVFIVSDAQEQNADEKDGKYWTFTCLSYDFNCLSFNRVPIRFRIDEFKGTKTINTLPVYPLKYHEDAEGKKDGDAVKRNLIERGKKFMDLCAKTRGEQMFQYEGDALVRGQGLRLSKASTSDDHFAADAASILVALFRRPGRSTRDTRSAQPEPKKRVLVE